MTPALPSGPLAQAIGWALLHVLWQGGLVAALLAVLLWRLPGRSASLRYALSCAALALIVALGIVTAFRCYPAAAPEAVVALRAAAASTGSEPRLPELVFSTMIGTPPNRLSAWLRTANDDLPALVALWLLGVAFFSLRLVLEWWKTRRLVNGSTPTGLDRLRETARRLGHALGVRHAVRLLESAAVEVPSVIGFVRPAILLPASTLTGLTPEQIEMILAHELAHIRRHDFLVNLLQTVVETLLFYHPAVWWISRQVRLERENCCDDLAVEVCGNPVHYARALARLEELRPARLPLAVSATGGSLLQRVRRLVGLSTRPSGLAARGATAAVVIGGIALALAVQSLSALGARVPAGQRVLAAAPHASVSRRIHVPMPGLLVTQASPPEAPEPPRPGEPATADEAPERSSAPEPAETPEPDVRSDPVGGRPSLDELIALRVQGVTPGTIRELRKLFPAAGLVDIAEMSAVGAGTAFVRGLRQEGLEVSNAREAMGLAAVGVTPQYVREMHAAGFALRSAGEAQSLKAVGVTPDYVSEMREAGVPLDLANDAQSLRAMGVTPEFVRRLAAAGYPHLTVEQLTRLAAGGVTGDFVREMSQYRTH